MDIKSKKDLMKYVGDLSQIYGVKDYCFNDGKSKNLRAFDVNNGSGLEFTVLADRGLDLLQVKKNGVNLGYRSKASLTGPQYYDSGSQGFFKNFYAGFLTTCGLTNIGLASTHEGKEYDMHGLWSTTPAEQVYGLVDENLPEPSIRIGGQIRESKLFGENFLVKREIQCPLFSNKIIITDEIENQGYKPEPLFLLYHFNFGYPLLDESAKVLLNSKNTSPRTEEAEKGLDNALSLQKPTANYKEQVFYHDLEEDSLGFVKAGIENPSLGLGVAMKYKKEMLPRLIHWKQMGWAEYALGLEPGNCLLSGRAQEIANNTVEYLGPWEKKTVVLEIETYETSK